jgi:hypothetical protein
MGSRWFPRTLATWKEPKAFCRQRVEKEVRAFPWLAWFLFIALFSVGLRLPDWVFDGFRLPAPADAFGDLIVVISLAAAPYVCLKLTRRVVIREDGISLGASHGSPWRFEELFRVVATDREVDGRRTTILRLESLQGKTLEVALGDTVSLSQIEEILRAQGVRFGE